MIGITLLLATITSTAQINALSKAEFSEHRLFAMTGTVTSVLFGDHYIFEDSTGRTHIRDHSKSHPRLGDRIVVTGDTSVDGFKQEQSDVRRMSVIGHGEQPEIQARTITDIATGQCDFENVTVDGFITDVFRDDIDPNWNYLILSAWGSFIYVTVPNITGVEAFPEQFTRRYVRVTGTVIPNHCGARRFIGPHVETAGFNSLEVLAYDDQSQATKIESISHIQPTEIVRYGKRVLIGTVRCTWGVNSLLLCGRDREIHRVDLADGIRLPNPGDTIVASGYPETDLFRINLSNAKYTAFPQEAEKTEEPFRYTAQTEDSLYDQLWKFHGQEVVFTGLVRAEPTAASGHRAILERFGVRLVFDVSSVPELSELLVAGTEVEARGCGLIEIGNWRPGTALPKQSDFVLVARSAGDLSILANPPWWTQTRVYTALIVLFTVLFGFLVWNRILTRIIKRRERQLMREETAHAAAELRTAERTRLAVELHDSLSQTLTGIACQIESADKARQKDPSRIERHLDLARSTLDSCRAELRNCIWDLRNHTLEDTDAESAIRRTVQPHGGSAEIRVRCTVERKSIPDNTFHDILCILRELVANAVRHGEAKHIAINGGISNGIAGFDVKDDGRGFDPENRPGSAEGHFGLLGITERLDRHDGSIEIRSAPGKGAEFHITIPQGK